MESVFRTPSTKLSMALDVSRDLILELRISVEAFFADSIKETENTLQLFVLIQPIRPLTMLAREN